MLSPATLLRFWRTLRHLKWRQVFWRLRHWARRKLPPLRPRGRVAYVVRTAGGVRLRAPSLPSDSSAALDGAVSMLNLSHRFEGEIDWGYSGLGGLWAYNLNFFDFLAHPGMPVGHGTRLIRAFAANATLGSAAYDSHPLSVRAINWIKFLLANGVRDAEADRSLSRQLDVLRHNPEHHLLGNHLLENAFGLYFGALYFDDAALLRAAAAILRPELEEQFLPDGAHFELSPMYHQVMLFRLLDCLNLVPGGSCRDAGLCALFEAKAAAALGWLDAVTFANGETPMVNDTAYGVAPSTAALKSYAAALGVRPVSVPLGASGYRMFRRPGYELFVDVGDIGPDYIPGHAHSDTFSFVLHVGGRPVVVDTGTSTYEKNQRRQAERSTAAHNTAQLDAFEQSEVWGGFRVARRAKVFGLEERGGFVQARHDGYARFGVSPRRAFEIEDGAVAITDQMDGAAPAAATAYFHFHPDVVPELVGPELRHALFTLSVPTEVSPRLFEYDCADGFNRTRRAVALAVPFQNQLTTTITLR